MKNRNNINFLILCFILIISNIKAQNNRLNNFNTIGWYNYFGKFNVSKKIGIHTEFQFRRDKLITQSQQNLMRIGINYTLNPRVLFRVGYGFIETYPYGDIPINSLGRDFSEHRIYEMVQLNHKEGIIDFTHRFMFEQRFVGKYSSANVKKEDEYPLLNRIRYMLRIQMPLKGKEIKDKTPYVAIYDEILIGLGKNVNANIFDQNRIGILFGYKFNKNVKIEAGYLNQTLQLGRQVNGHNVFQNNNGIILNTYFNFDLMKSKKQSS